jgi:UDP-N-acetylmuramoylalanine--D-glutamate ligase
MKDWKAVFESKKITVMGLGLLGRAVGDARFLAEMGAKLIVTDLKNETELATSLEILKPYKNITYRLGGHDLADFSDRDFILKAAGVPLDSVYIAEAKKNKIPIQMSASWFVELAQIPVVGVTGTRGKSTTTHLLEAIMRPAGQEVLLGGNIRGVSTLALLPQVTSESIALMELDSWQCAGFGDAGLSPNVAVFTTFLDDHLNYYGGKRDIYLGEKAQIFLHQKPEDTLVVSSQALPFLEKYKSKIAAHVVIADPAHLSRGWTLAIPGEHNRLNAICAIEAARALGIDDEVIRSALAAFRGVPGRLEFVREVRGVNIYNDTTSTTPDATIAALRALGDTRNIVLILGGADKGLDTAALMAEIALHAKVAVYLAGSGTDKLGVVAHDRLVSALDAAMQESAPGDIVLFSPGFASFGMFQNEFDRGYQFEELVRRLSA